MSPPLATPPPPPPATWPRLALLACVALGTLYCSGAPVNRSSRTLVSVGGGYAQAIDNRYNCGGDVTRSETQLQSGGSAEVVHEDEAGWVAGVEVAAQRSDVRELRAAGQIALEGSSEKSLASYWQRAAAVRMGWDFAHFGIDGGANFYMDGNEVKPYLAVRGGAIHGGFYADAQLGQRHPLWDPTLLSAGVHFRDERFRAGVSLASIVRRVLSHGTASGAVTTESYSWASAKIDTDPALIGYAELWPQSNAGIRLTGIGADTWGATVSLILALGSDSEPAERNWRGQATPLPDAPPAAATPAAATPSTR